MRNGDPVKQAGLPCSLSGTRHNASLSANPGVRRLMQDTLFKQKGLLDSLPSGSSSLCLVALEVLQKRVFLSAPTSELRVHLTGKGLGGGRTEEERAEKERAEQISRLQQEIKEFNDDVASIESTVEDMARRYHQVDPDSRDGRAYDKVHELLANELNVLRAKRAVAEANLKNLVDGVGGSRG